MSAAETFEIKQGDLEPPIAAVITDEATISDDFPDGEPISLVGCTVEFRFRNERKGSQLLGGAATIDDAAGGEVSYAFVDGDTDVPGSYVGEFIATRTVDGYQRTFPSGNARVAWMVRPRLASD